MMHFKYLGSFVVEFAKEQRIRCSSRHLRKIVPIELNNQYTFFIKHLSIIIAILFMIGSFCFFIASFFLLFAPLTLSLGSTSTIYFVGSIFFTLAAYSQYLQSINADITNEQHTSFETREWIWFAFRWHNLGFLSSFIQLIGTILFNLNTYDAMIANMNFVDEVALISAPDMIGSICFLLASFFAWLEVYYDKDMRPFGSILWWIIWLNILGSIFFQISAIYGFALPTANSELQDIATYFTMFGGFCFFAGSYLLIPESKKR